MSQPVARPAPQQLRARLSGLTPVLVAIEAAVSQAQHARLQTAQHGLAHCPFAVAVGPHVGVQDEVPDVVGLVGYLASWLPSHRSFAASQAVRNGIALFTDKFLTDSGLMGFALLRIVAYRLRKLSSYNKSLLYLRKTGSMTPCIDDPVIVNVVH